MQSLKLLLRLHAGQCRSLTRSSVAVQLQQAEVQSQPALQVPQPDGEAKVYSQKIEKLVSDISQLNLLEVSQLSDALKKRLNLPDAPVMAMGAFPMGGAPSSPEDEDEVVPVKVQTSFTVKLIKFSEKQKVALIKEIKNLVEGMNLVQAKKFVESAPAIVKADISKEEAEKLKEALVSVGAEVEIV